MSEENLLSTITLILKILFLFYGLALLLLYFTQDKLLFFPDQRPLIECHLMTNPQFEYQQHLIDGETIRFIKYKNEKAQGNLILFHGNAGSACDRGFYVDGLKESPVNIILAEYPGYGGDSNKVSAKSILENGQALFDFIKNDNLPIILYGESLGTGVATWLASKNQISGLLLNHPYTSISEVGFHHYPFFPIGLINRHDFPSKKWAKDVKVKPIVFQGDRDQVIPLEFIEKQIQNFKEAPEYIKIEGAGHNDLLTNQEVFLRANQYISKVLLQ